MRKSFRLTHGLVFGIKQGDEAPLSGKLMMPEVKA